MPTQRSRELRVVVPLIRAAVRSVLSGVQAEEAEQRSLIALAPHAQRLSTMHERERSVYVWKTATRVAFRIRREQRRAEMIFSAEDASGDPSYRASSSEGVAPSAQTSAENRERVARMTVTSGRYS